MQSNRRDLDNFFKILEREGLKLTEDIKKKLWSYHRLILEWGKKLPLVSKKELGQGLFKHYYDAFGLSKFVRGEVFIDLGSGAGLPGIPLVIFKKDVKGILLDVNLKKTTFLKFAVQKLGLYDRLDVVRGRWEEVDFSVDTAISKATGQIEELRKHLVHLIKPGGEWIRFARKEENLLSKERVESFYNPFRRAEVRIIVFKIPLCPHLRGRMSKELR